MAIEIIPVAVDREIVSGDDLATLIADAGPALCGGDVVVVTHKAVSKSEGRVVDLAGVAPSARAVGIAGDGGDPRLVELVLRESVRVLRQRGSLLIVETNHGFVCANAGIDRSNAPRPDSAVLLPVDPDASAARLRGGLLDLTGALVGVVVADTMGRAWREGVVGTAIGVSGLMPLRDLRGEVDPNGYELSATVVAIADELAAAADLVLGKLDRVPAAVIRGARTDGEGTARALLRDPGLDLFR